MTEGALVAARYLDGRVTKGRAIDFAANADLTLIASGNDEEVRIPAGELKALFFIKDIEGNPEREERKSFRDSQLLGKRVWVIFHDGEEMAGWSQSFRRGKHGFYLFPTDPRSNIEMAYVFGHATREVLEETAAETASRKYQVRIEQRRGGYISREDWDDFLTSSR